MQTQQTTILPQLTNLLMNLIPQHVHMIAVNQFQLIWAVYGQMVLQQCGGKAGGTVQQMEVKFVV